MAWSYVSTIGDLVMSYYDGEEDREVNIVNCKSAQMYADQINHITNNPWSQSGIPLHTVRSNQGSDYTMIQTLGDAGRGTIDLREMYNILPAGRAMYIWRRSMTKNYRIVFTKGNWNFTVTYIAAGQNVFSTTLNVRDASLGCHQSLAFWLDSDNGVGNFYVIYYLDIGGYLSPRQLGVDYLYSGTATATRNAISSCVFPLLVNNTPQPEPTPSTDPYADGGTSSTGGGGGDFDNASDTISLPSVPALNLTLSKMLNAYHISITDLNDLADWIWGNYDKTDASKVLSKIFADPTDAILALFMLPFTPGYSSAIPVTVGGYAAGSLEFSPLSQQFYDVDCGTLTINEYWGNYLDYNPYTRLTLFLPGVGEVQLDPDEVMGKTIGVLYRVDCLTGQFVCFVYGDNKIFAQYQGNCALQVPVSSADYSRLNSSMLQAATMAAGVAVGVSTGGGMAALAEGADALPSTALNLLNSKVNHSHSGSLGGASFFLGSQKPYVIIHRARQSVPEYANTFYGYPSNVTAVLGSLTGFTSVKNVILDDLPLTKGELDSLRDILAAGFYI